ncbi:MAG: DUF4160 domain-containing protein [Cyanobacteria bacterium P01_C01_bin.89]
MPVFYRSRGYRFTVISGDHTPPHVHIIGQGGYVKAVLGKGEVEYWEIEGKISKTTAKKLIDDLEKVLDAAWTCWNQYGGID